MIHVVFVCLGNICRSPMAEAVFQKIAEEKGVLPSFRISSRATSDCEEGNPVYSPAQRVLREHGYDFAHTARQITLKEVINADYILVMDSINLRDLTRLTGGRCGEKIYKLGSFLPEESDIDDPWYTRDFERTFREISLSCEGFMTYLLRERADVFGYDKRH